MNKMFVRFLLCTLLIAGILTSPALVKAQDFVDEMPLNENGNAPVALEFKDGSTVVVYMLKEGKDNIYVRNMSDSMEVSLPRSRIANIRPATQKDIQKMEKQLGIEKKPAPTPEKKKPDLTPETKK